MKKFIILLTEEYEGRDETSITSIYLENTDIMGILENFNNYKITIEKLEGEQDGESTSIEK